MINEIIDYVNIKLWFLVVCDQVQYFNVDQVICGFGCFGNFYDVNWVFIFFGYGDLYEVGYNYECGCFKFNGCEGYVIMNFYSYYVKQQYYFFIGLELDCQLLFFVVEFDLFQDVFLVVDFYVVMNVNSVLNSWSYGVGVFIQMFMVGVWVGVVI